MPAKRKPNPKPVQKPPAAAALPVKAAPWYPIETIADRLKKARAMSEYAGDQKIIPSLMGISYASLTSYERGAAAPRRFVREALARFADLYGCDLDWLIYGTPSASAIPVGEDTREAWERALSPTWERTVENMDCPAQMAA